MIGLSMLEVVVMALFIWGFVTQVGIPAVKGTALFPMFESSEAKLRKEKERAEQRAREAQLRREIAEVMNRTAAETKDMDATEAVRAYRIAQDEGEER